MLSRLAPQQIISLAGFFVLFVFWLSSYVFSSAPWLGIELGSGNDCEGLCVKRVEPTGPATGKLFVGESITSILDTALVLDSRDLMEEPDALSVYDDYQRFLKRQGEIASALMQTAISLQMSDGRTITLSPNRSRPLSTYPWEFWYQLICGAVVFLAGMSVFAYRPQEQVTGFYALTGFGLLLACCSAAVYSSRELAMDYTHLYGLSLINEFGSMLFAGSFISILWYYPKRLHAFPLGPVVIAVYLLIWLLNALKLFDSLDLAMRLPLLIGLVINFIFAVMQWHQSRHQPLQRAILKWFLLAWMTGTSLYLGLYTLPVFFHVDSVITQTLGWGILVTVYLGIALGITRFRLFNLDRWVVTGWLWFLGGVGVIALDALLVYILNLSDQLALAIALGMSGWLYFPIRQFLWSRFTWSRKFTNYRDLLPHLLTTLLNAQGKALASEWRQILKRIYSPLHIETIEQSFETVCLDKEGVSLLVPGLQDIPGLRLTYAERGNRLFNKEDQRFADAIHQLFCRIQEFRNAFANGVQQERQRLARDLHDDVGARLLTLVYSSSEESQAELARETLNELRSVIHDLESRHNLLFKTLAGLRVETARRCESHGVELDWRQAGILEDISLEARQHANLKRILREAVSNALRHGRTSILQINVGLDDFRLMLYISNDVVGEPGEEDLTPGRGIRNIRSRTKELGGTVSWQFGEESLLGGCTVRVEIPIQE